MTRLPFPKTRTKRAESRQTARDNEGSEEQFFEPESGRELVSDITVVIAESRAAAEFEAVPLPSHIPLPVPKLLDHWTAPGVLASNVPQLGIDASEPGEVPLVMEVRYADEFIAADWLQRFEFIRQRKLKPKHVTSIVNAMLRKHFPQTTTIVFAHLAGNTYLIDGRHRLSSVIKSHTRQRFIVHHLLLQSPKELIEAYIRYDVGMSKSQSDAIVAANLSEETNLSISFLRRMMSSLNIIADGFSSARQPQRDRQILLDNLLAWQPECTFYYDIYADAAHIVHKPLLNAGPSSLALVTLRHQKEKALEFWTRVAHNDGLPARSPEARLVEYLATMHDEEMRRGEIHARKVAACWNAFFLGKNAPSKLPNNAAGPIHIEGTPYTEKTVIRL